MFSLSGVRGPKFSFTPSCACWSWLSFSCVPGTPAGSCGPGVHFFIHTASETESDYGDKAYIFFYSYKPIYIYIYACTLGPIWLFDR